MITITLGTIPPYGTTGPMDTASTEIEGAVLATRSRSSAVCELCRLLRDRGVPDQPWEAVTPTGKASLRGPSIYAMADRTIEERDRGGLRWKKYQPHPMSHPAR